MTQDSQPFNLPWRVFRHKLLRPALITLGALTAAGCITELPGEFPHQEEICSFDADREAQRAVSAANFPQPQIHELLVNGQQRWNAVNGGTPLLTPGDIVTLRGTGH